MSDFQQLQIVHNQYGKPTWQDCEPIDIIAVSGGDPFAMTTDGGTFYWHDITVAGQNGMAVQGKFMSQSKTAPNAGHYAGIKCKVANNKNGLLTYTFKGGSAPQAQYAAPQQQYIPPQTGQGYAPLATPNPVPMAPTTSPAVSLTVPAMEKNTSIEKQVALKETVQLVLGGFVQIDDLAKYTKLLYKAIQEADKAEVPVAKQEIANALSAPVASNIEDVPF